MPPDDHRPRLFDPSGRGTKAALKVAQRVWRLQRGVTLGAQAVVVNADGAVLLVRHGYRPGWHFPGGGVERGESALTAIHRELVEEVGVVPEVTPELFGLYTNFVAYPGDHVVLFVVRRYTRPVIPAPRYEIREQKFFARHDPPPETVGPVERRLAELFDAAPRSETW